MRVDFFPHILFEKLFFTINELLAIKFIAVYNAFMQTQSNQYLFYENLLKDPIYKVVYLKNR